MTTPRDLGVRFGKLTTTSATFVFLSRSNTSVTLTVDGTEYAGITMSAIGTDRSVNDPAGTQTFGYAGSQAVTFSAGFTSRNWTAVQGVTTVTGTLLPAPGKYDNFAIALTTCQRANVSNDGTKFAPTGHKFMDWYRQNGALPLVANIHTDDLIYADGANHDETAYQAADPNGKQIESQVGSAATRTAYDFCMYYGCLFGIAGPVTVGGVEYLNSGLLSYSTELFNNIAYMPQWGDHEFMNNIGWQLPAGNGQLLSSVPNPYHATAGGYNGKGLTVYNTICAPLQGTSAQSADTDSNHWYVDFGPLRIVTMDPITKAVPNYPSDNTATFGTNQIDDVLNVLNVRKPFKLLCTTVPFMRETTNANAFNTAVNGSTVKYWQNKQPTERKRLFVNSGQTPKSLMDNSETNGGYGITSVIYADWHMGLCLYQQAAADTGIVAEGYHSVCLSGVCQHGESSNETRIFDSTDFLDDSMEYFGGGMSGSPTPKPYKSVCAIVEVRGGDKTPNMIIRVFDLYQAATANDPDSAGPMGGYMNLEYHDETDDEGNIWSCIYERKLVLYTGNYGYTTSETAWDNAGVSVGGLE